MRARVLLVPGAAWLAALVLFSLLFRGIGFDFWLQMSLSVLCLCGLAAAADGRGLRRELGGPPTASPVRILAVGLASAAVLYGVFMVGNAAARRLFSFAPGDIQRVYAMKQGVPTWRIALMIGLVIGPGEEIFWRGFFQRRLARHLGPWSVPATALAYGTAHFLTANAMLIIAALVAGLFWGWIYHRTHSLWTVMVSHVAWDLAIFVLWPVA